MRVKFTTSLDSDLLEKIKIQAVKEKTNVNKILEKLIEQYLEGRGDDSSPTQEDGGILANGGKIL